LIAGDEIMATTQIEDLLTVAEAAALLRVSQVTLRRWIKQGRLASCRVGPRAVRIRRRDVEGAIEPALQETAAVRPPYWDPSHRVITDIAELYRPMSEERKRRWLAAMERSKALTASMAARNGGKPLAETWPIINEERDKRDGFFD
jgi:excisionase family DNA binding protein